MLRVVAVVDGQCRELDGEEALADSAGLLAEPEASRLGRPRRARRLSQVEAVGAALGLHPLIVEDVLEGNQRAKIETTDGIVHIVLFHLDYDARARRIRARHRPRARVPADRPRCDVGSARRPTTCAPASSRSSATGRTTCCGRSPTTSSTATSRSRIALGDAIDEVQDEVVREADAGDARAAVRPQARADRGPPLDQPGPRGLQPADEPRHAADRPRGDRLLPRHLRPRHPADRRARQLPRARVGDARRLPDEGQQQPVGDHEAADRRDGHPGRDRRDRGDLRDERGGSGDRGRGGGGVLARHRP